MKKLFTLIILFWSILSSAQYFNDGQDRGNLKWERISTLHFEVIFPKGFEQQGQRVAKLMEKSYEFTTQSLQHNPKKISIILHTETVKSNAFLGWAPSRIEMYTTPHQDIYSQDWLEQLAIHEYRHMVQISKLESEMPKMLRFLFGEQAAALLTAAYLPFWFIEGDAVVAETALSESGRGRYPGFHRELKAQVLDKGIYSYDKAYLGSYKDYVANHYHLGYFMVGGAREIFNKTIWEDVEHHIARRPFSPNTFNKGLKNSIGINKVELYDTIFNTLKRRWQLEDSLKTLTPFRLISKSHKYHTNYNFGFFTDDSTYFAEKTGMAEIGTFISIDKNGIEKNIYTPGYHFNKSVAGKDSLLIWIERLTHPRWYHSDHSLLRILNTNTGEVNEFKYNTKLFSPSVSPDSKYIVAVEGNNQYQFHLDIIELSSGQIVDSVQTSSGEFLITPSWSENGNFIYVVALRNNKKGILKFNLVNNNAEVILPFVNQEISNPVEYLNEVYFIGGYSGTDNLYKVNSVGEVSEVINSRFGLTDPSFKNNKVLYSDYTSNGYQLVEANLDSINYKKVDISNMQIKYPIAEAISKQEAGSIDFGQLDDIQYNAEKYSKVANLLKVHSWAPIAIDPVAQSAMPGFSVMSQNMLSTAEFVAGYRYNLQSTQGEWYANFKYYGFYPVLEIDTYTGKRNTYYHQLQSYINSKNEVVRVDTIRQDYSYNETSLVLNTYLPFNLSKGKYHKKIQPRLKYRFTQLDADYRAPNTFPSGTIQTIEGGVYMYQILKTSKQDLLPNFGILLDLSFAKTLSGILNYGTVYALSNVVYLPGIKPNHGITVYNGFQRKSYTETTFSDRIRFPRGHVHIPNNQLYCLGTDYQLPLINSDLSIFNFAYIKRVNLKVFYDHAFYSGKMNTSDSQVDYNGQLRSTGIELTSNLHLLRFIAPIEFGFRTSYLFNENFKNDFLFNIQFTF